MAFGVPEALEKMGELQKKDPAGLAIFFGELLKGDGQTALNAVNDERCPFPVFFLLIPMIKAGLPPEGLSPRNLLALSLYESRLRGAPGDLDEDLLYREALKWMLSSGRERDGISDIYDELLDAAAIRLIIVFRDAPSARDAVKLCFARNRRGAFNHDLVWALFRSFSLGPLFDIAEYLLSPDERDVRFACGLLYLKPPRNTRDEAEKKALRDSYLGWLNENGEYLYFTGDSFQRTSEPVFSALNSSAKYIGRPVSRETGLPIGELTPREQMVMALFGSAESGEKARLLAYSEKLRKKAPAAWSGFLDLTFSEQRSAARDGAEGMV